ncbi:MAG: chromosome segregation protein SMC [Deltaproteobacteria bacterium]|nr:chromosome segregation protein SMC [Deltaproteobacteria bacterium]
MRIKRLELVGFKSFLEPTVIDFDAPIVGVVGPNGCGKSNVVDAIRWVMGEMSPRSLRGRSMEDVIFNGSEKRAPVGMAEVSLTFSTEDGIVPAEYASFSEIMITRRLYRSGDSEYLVNKIPARLRDVIDLFLGTGVGHKAYSIIEQGKIDFAINAKPEDRRLLLEEAAGVSKFKARKESALRKMESTEQNLARLRDILHEVTRQINSLDRQVKKAERYKILKDELRELELKLSSLSFLNQTQEHLELSELFEDWQRRESNSSIQLTTLETDLERGRIDLTEKERQLSSLQERSFEVQSRLQLLGTQQGFQKKEIHRLEETRILSLREVEEIKERLQSLTLEKQDYEKRKSEGEETRRDYSITLQTAEKELHEIEQKRDELTRQIDLTREERYQGSAQLARLEGEKRLFEEKRISFKSQIASKRIVQEESTKQLTERQARLQQRQEIFQSISDQVKSLKLELEKQKEELALGQERKQVLNEEIDLQHEALVLKRSRLKSLLELEKNFEGYEEGVRAILKEKKSEVFGVVAEFIETAPQYELALSAVLGEKLQYVVVKSHEEGVDAINYLKLQSAGRSSFIPLDIRDHSTESFSSEHSGVLGPLLHHVQIKKGYQAVANSLLGDVVLIKTLADALAVWKTNGHKKTLVTLEGEVVDPTGVVSGGTSGIRGKMLLEKKREIRDLQTIIAEMENEVGLKEDTFSQLEGHLSDLTIDLESLSHRHHEEELKQKSLEQEVQHLGEECRRVESEAQKLAQEISQLTLESDQVQHSLGEVVERNQGLSENLGDHDQALSKQEEELREVLVNLRHLQDHLSGLRVQAAADSERKALSDREIERLLKTETDLHQRIEQKLKEITDSHQKGNLLDKSIEEATVEIESLKKIAGELVSHQDTLKTSYETLSATVQEKTAQLKNIRKENELAKSHTGDLRVTISRVESELNHLEQQINEKYLVNLKEMNLGAIPEYEELKTRQQFLTQQIEDLETSINALKKAIQQVNQTTRKRFEETFHRVNERFQTLFPRLFQGGRAELRLTNEEDLLNSGVELLVQPPGKKLSHVGLLSGGEKAMSAVAFVFSIFLVKPSPFCILDEVDAPLDDLNTQRFHKLITELTSRTQFILITHNRGTMERADLLYGVTMQEPGVSKLVSVRLSEGLKLAS